MYLNGMKPAPRKFLRWLMSMHGVLLKSKWPLQARPVSGLVRETENARL
jgi:hypothetical protein